jgi:hypothetical protein
MAVKELVSGGCIEDEVWVWTVSGLKFPEDKIRFYAAEMVRRFSSSMSFD